MWFSKNKSGKIDSKAALKESVEKLEETESRANMVTEVSTALRILRERNHLVEQLKEAMGGRS